MDRIKCHQRTIREKKELEEDKSFLSTLSLNPENAVVKVVDYKTAKKVITEYEWLGTMPAGAFLCVALYFGEHIAGVEVFTESKPGGMYTIFNEPATCLARGCCVYWAPRWASSFLISRALKILEEHYNGSPRFVIAYSDWEAGEIGTVYQSTNWTYIGHKGKPEWRSPNGKRYDEKHHRDIAKTRDKEFKQKKKLNPQIALDVKNEMLQSGWTRRSTLRGTYIKVIGQNGKEKRRLERIAKKNAKPYPKSHKI